jgi:hypothetical protein
MRDEFLKELKENTEKIVSTLWTDESLLPKDNLCRFQLGVKSDQLRDSMITRQNFTCSMCKTLSKLLAGNKHVVGTTIMLECGHKAGCTLNIETYPDENFKLSRDDEVERIIRNNIDGMYDDAIVYELDNFSNILLNTLIMESVWSDNVRSAYMGFICSNTGYIINDSLKYSSIDQLPKELITEELVDGLIGQLLISLKKYANVVFLIGSPSLDTIGFSEDAISMEHTKHVVKCDLTLKFKHMKYNSIDVKSKNKCRLVNVNPVDKMLLRHSFSSLVNDIEAVSVDPLTVKFSPKQFDVYQRYIKVGVPLFASTWNLYICLILLMTNESIRAIVGKVKHLKKLWDYLWDPNEIPSFTKLADKEINLRPFMVNRSIKVGCLDEVWNIYKTRT